MAPAPVPSPYPVKPLAVVLALALASCAPPDSSTRGTNIPETMDLFQRGVSTIVDVQAALGKPLSIVRDADGVTSLVYARTTTTISTKTSAGRAVTFRFGPDGILKDYATSDSTINF
jgi:hypothetical protein